MGSPHASMHMHCTTAITYNCKHVHHHMHTPTHTTTSTYCTHNYHYMQLPPPHSASCNMWLFICLHISKCTNAQGNTTRTSCSGPAIFTSGCMVHGRRPLFTSGGGRRPLLQCKLQRVWTSIGTCTLRVPNAATSMHSCMPFNVCTPLHKWY